MEDGKEEKNVVDERLKKIGSDRELKSWELYRSSGGGPPIEQWSRVVRAWITISTFKYVCVCARAAFINV